MGKSFDELLWLTGERYQDLGGGTGNRGDAELGRTVITEPDYYLTCIGPEKRRHSIGEIYRLFAPQTLKMLDVGMATVKSSRRDRSTVDTLSFPVDLFVNHFGGHRGSLAPSLT